MTDSASRVTSPYSVDRVDVLLMTALEDELDALIGTDSAFTGRKEEVWRSSVSRCGLPFRLAHFEVRSDEIHIVSVAAASPGHMGEAHTALYAASLATELQPSVLGMCGVCAGVDGLDLGSLIVVQEAWTFDEQKVEERRGQGRVRGQVRSRYASKELCSIAMQAVAESMDHVFPADLLDPNSNQRPRVLEGVVETVKQVLEVQEPFVKRDSIGRKTIAIEMELFSFLNVGTMLQIPSIAVKGVQDYGRPGKDDTYREYSSRAAAYLALHSTCSFVVRRRPKLILKPPHVRGFPTEVPSMVLAGQSIEVDLGENGISVESSVFIENGATLKLRGRGIVRMAANTAILAKGRLLIDGETEDPLIFGPADNTLWNGVVLVGKGASESRIRNVVFKKARGCFVTRQSPVRSQGPRSYVPPTPQVHLVKSGEVANRAGGALAIFDADDIEIESCSFEENAAHEGGALVAKNVRRLVITGCRFHKNEAVGSANRMAPGGAVFLQNCADSTIRGSEFVENAASDRYSCGGALYVGLNSSLRLQATSFSRNRASNTGGAVYGLGLPVRIQEHEVDTRCQIDLLDVSFSDDRAEGTAHDPAGSCMHFDDGAIVTIEDVRVHSSQQGAVSLVVSGSGRRARARAPRVHFHQGKGLVASGDWRYVYQERGDVDATGAVPPGANDEPE